MTEKERKHQYYLRHKAEAIERARRWHEANPEKSRECRDKAKRKWIANHREYLNACNKASYQRRRSNETPEEAEARRAKWRERGMLYRRKKGMKERVPLCQTDDERRILEAKRWRDRYHDPDKHDALKQYERERKRAYRERKKLEKSNNNK